MWPFLLKSLRDRKKYLPKFVFTVQNDGGHAPAIPLNSDDPPFSVYTVSAGYVACNARKNCLEEVCALVNRGKNKRSECATSKQAGPLFPLSAASLPSSAITAGPVYVQLRKFALASISVALRMLELAQIDVQTTKTCARCEEKKMETLFHSRHT